MDIVQEGYRQQEKFKEPEESAQTMGRQAQAWMQLYPEQFQASEASYYLAQICRASGANGFALDEISWQQIEQEKSIAILRAILAIAAIPSRDSNFWHWRRYILEDAQLWPYLVATPAAL